MSHLSLDKAGILEGDASMGSRLYTRTGRGGRVTRNKKMDETTSPRLQEQPEKHVPSKTDMEPEKQSPTMKEPRQG